MTNDTSITDKKSQSVKSVEYEPNEKNINPSSGKTFTEFKNQVLPFYSPRSQTSRSSKIVNLEGREAPSKDHSDINDKGSFTGEGERATRLQTKQLNDLFDINCQNLIRKLDALYENTSKLVSETHFKEKISQNIGTSIEQLEQFNKARK